MRREDIVATARTYVGTPFRHQGRTHMGVDCIGLIWCVARDLGYAPAIPANYMMLPRGGLLDEHCARLLILPEDQTPKPGRIGVFSGIDPGTPQHFATIASHGRPTLIHALSKHKQVVEHGMDRFWLKKLLRVYDLPGVED